jgi:NADH-quinone oxidoreductase subunit N
MNGAWRWRLPDHAACWYCFKIAAVPMHFYTADVYQGASPAVSAFLAFVPKTAGSCRSSPASSVESVGRGTLARSAWAVAPRADCAFASGSSRPHDDDRQRAGAAAEVGAKRMLAYSSIAHSGYMLVGVIAGPAMARSPERHLGGAVLPARYGVMNAGTFAVLSGLERKTARRTRCREIDSIDDIRGLCATHPRLGWPMALCSLSLLGFPPCLASSAKLPLFTSAISAGEIIRW